MKKFSFFGFVRGDFGHFLITLVCVMQRELLFVQHFTLKGLKTHTITFRNLQTKMSDEFRFGESGRFIVLSLEQSSNDRVQS